MKVREIEVAVISDIHLATHACKPKKVLKYLKSIQPKTLVLNGDIIDSWRFSRNYFPKPQLKVIRQLIKMMEKGVQVYYITGNHDEFLRKFSQTQIGNLRIVNQLILDLDGSKTWIFHGDIFDNVIHQTKWLAKLGAATYGMLTMLNQIVNRFLQWIGKPEIIIYKKIKKYTVREKINPSSFESAIGNSAFQQGYQTVICGHTHIPKEKQLTISGQKIQYLNCGDWVEHFTAAEYCNSNWSLFYYNEPDDEFADDLEVPEERKLYQSLVKELVFANVL
ncbi:MAG TPA: UDP-2,3-diacylglucosamine diphosphatase [Draconibacterium sp.]|jgi:UDP-2,3-diacylglucosamine pyrophosphatase LpxH|nr:UDP-2,3-diacylglucosamine diphosphatase [Draconibacterium sp.]